MDHTIVSVLRSQWGVHVLRDGGRRADVPGHDDGLQRNACVSHVFPLSENTKDWINNRDLLGSYALQIGSASSVGISYVSSYFNNPNAYSFTGAFTENIGYPPSISQTTNEVRLNASTEISGRLSLDASWYFARGSYHMPNPATFVPLSNPSSFIDKDFPYNAPRLGVTWRESGCRNSLCCGRWLCASTISRARRRDRRAYVYSGNLYLHRAKSQPHAREVVRIRCPLMCGCIVIRFSRSISIERISTGSSFNQRLLPEHISVFRCSQINIGICRNRDMKVSISISGTTFRVVCTGTPGSA